MPDFDEVPDILPPYDSQFKVWECAGYRFKQHDLVSQVGLASTYSLRLNVHHSTPPDAPARYLTVQENRITNVMAHQPILGADVFDKWGKYLGRGGDSLDPPGEPSGVPHKETLPSTHEQGSKHVGAVQFETVNVLPDGLRPSPPPPDPRQTPDPWKITTRSHKLWLREDLEIQIELPLDLTQNEAERIALFVTALPLSSEDKFT